MSNEDFDEARSKALGLFEYGQVTGLHMYSASVLYAAISSSLFAASFLSFLPLIQLIQM
jgi:hypothetical protein